MGSLSNLYISQSYQSLIQLGSNTSASATLIQLQDGLGNNLGVALNTQGDISASGDINASTLRIELDTEITGAVDINTFFTASTPGYTNSTNPYFTDVVRVVGSYPSNIDYPTINDVRVGWICNGINVTNGIVTAVSGSGTGDVYVTIAGTFPQISQPYTFRGRFSVPVRITGSVHVSNDITASGNLYVSGTINSNRVITTTISSSQIYSSGSNIFGDSISDSQTLVGGTTISGSLTVDGQLIHRGNVEITGSLKVSNDISSSTVSGIGNVTAYSASVQSFINSVSSSISGTINTLSQSVDSRLDYLEGPFSTSVDQRLDSLEFFSSSQETKDLTLASYTGSNDTKWSTLTNVTASVLAFTSSQETKNITLGNYTASLINAFTASGKDVTFNGNINVSGSISAYQLNVLVESSSVIFSSGSNVLGDASNDTQTLNGTVNVVNTLFVSGTEFTPFSQSVDLRLDQLEAFSSSVNLDFVTQNELAAATGSLINSIATKLNTSSFEAYTGSQDTKNTTLASVTASLLSSQTNLNAFSASQITKDSTLATYTASVDSKFVAVGSSTASLNSYTQSNDTKWSTLQNVTASLINATGSYATTGSNVFIGSEIISGSLLVTGSMIYSGSVRGQVTDIIVSSLTASIDCSKGNFFRLNLGSASAFRLTATNIQPGETIGLRIDKTALNATVVIDSGSIKFPSGLSYTISPDNNIYDVLTFISFDTGSLYAVAAKNFV
jgi:cytoskeletal protein CcmA (bactofilin family)